MAFDDKDNNIIIDRDYVDNFSMKKSVLDKLGPKYFEDVELAGLNVGVLGFTMEQIANLAEDSFNTASVLINEAFPNRAVIPESIYSHAAIFQIDNLFSHCAQCSFVILLDQREVIKNGEKSGNKVRFHIDKDTVLTVEDIPFTFDYDIEILAQKNIINGVGEDYSFSAKYVIDFKNSISEVNDPYIKIRKTADGLLMLQLVAHQVERVIMTDTIINNTKINYPVLEFPLEEDIAGFDVFYRAPDTDEYIQLEKRIAFSLPLKTPFCFYRLKDENTLALEFSSRDNYFQPEFNSEIKVVIYNTIGKKGNFEIYEGNKYDITLNDEKYEYNDNITMAVKTVSPSTGGMDKLGLDALKSLAVEGYSTAKEISTESDVSQYFYNNKYRYGNEIFVLKRRDDSVERLLSAFLLMKNEDYIYPTNTLHINLKESEYDFNDKNNRFVLQPGHVFTYEEGSMNMLSLIPNTMCYETDKVAELMKDISKFYFTNPFLISMTKDPNMVGFYQTIINKTCALDYISSNSSTFTQFIASSISINRSLSAPIEITSASKEEGGNGMMEKYPGIKPGKYAMYNFKMNIMPSSDIDPIEDDDVEVIIGDETEVHHSVRVIAAFLNNHGSEVGYIEMTPEYENDNPDSSISKFNFEILTHDYVTADGLFDAENVIGVDGKLGVYLPITDVTMNIYIMYDDALTEKNRFSKYFDGLEYFVITNVYSNRTDPITFIKPMNMMRSSVTFTIDEERHVNSKLSLVPMIRADVVSDTESFDKFITMLTSNYIYLEDSLPILRNTTNLDVKFFNTYGKSSNYFIAGEKGIESGNADTMELIDTINIQIEFRITLMPGSDDIEIIQKIKKYIKDFIERLNSSGNNDLYISNLIKGIETNFAEVHHLRFIKINNYNSSYQTIITKEPDLSKLSKKERQEYVPEMLVIDTDNIHLVVDTLD